MKNSQGCKEDLESAQMRLPFLESEREMQPSLLEKEPEMKNYMGDDVFTFSAAPEFYMFENEDDWLFKDLENSGPIFEQMGEYTEIKQEKKLSATFQIIDSRQERHQSTVIQGNSGDISGGRPARVRQIQDVNPVEEHKNQTKNIPKNFGKEIIRFVKTNRPLIERMLSQISSPARYEDLNKQLQTRKKKMNRIQNIRGLWTECEYSRQVRVISQYFLRKRSINWIYNSRIERRAAPLKYRVSLSSFLRNPAEFHHLKSQ